MHGLRISDSFQGKVSGTVPSAEKRFITSLMGGKIFPRGEAVNDKNAMEIYS